MVNNTDAGPSDPAQDQTGEASANPVAEPETRTIEVLLVPTNNEARLQAVQAGGTPKGVRIRVSPTAPGLTGVTADGAAVWTGWKSRGTALQAAVDGDDITAALVALRDREAAEQAALEALEARRAANRKAVEAAGLTWIYDANEAETTEEALEIVRQYYAEQAEKEAAAQKLREEHNAEIVAAGLPDGYKPWCTGQDKPYGVSLDGQLLDYRRYHTPEGAVAAAQHHADEMAAKARRVAEKEAWINEHGSDGLKDRVARGYNCQRRYMEERLAAELPGWTLHKWDGQPDWDLRDRSCPSDDALVLEDEAKAGGLEATTSWAVWEARYDDDHEDEETSGEVVVVEDFHGYLIYHET